MKSSALIDHGHLPPMHVNLASFMRWVFQGLPHFHSYSTSVYYITKEQKTGNAWKQGYSHGAIVEKVSEVYCHFLKTSTIRGSTTWPAPIVVSCKDITHLLGVGVWLLAKETDWGVLCTEEWVDPCKIEFQEMVISWKRNQVNYLFQSFLGQVTKLRKGNSKDSILDSVTGILPVYKTIGVGNYHLYDLESQHSFRLPLCIILVISPILNNH